MNVREKVVWLLQEHRWCHEVTTGRSAHQAEVLDAAGLLREEEE